MLTSVSLSLEYHKRVFHRLLKDTPATHLIEKLGQSATVSEDLLYQVMSLSKNTYIVEKLMNN